jgi:cysteine desulfurase/selenocysteine lyase
VLYGKRQLLQKLEPSSYGGGMIARVERLSSTWADSPARFEAGTPNIVGATGLGAAIDYIGSLGIEQITDYEAELSQYFLNLAHSIQGLTLYGPDELAERGPVFSFNLDGIHAHDLAQVLDEHHIAVRAGHHCNQILMNKLGVPAALRASLGLYNEKSDIDRLFDALEQAKNIFSK